MSDKEGYVHINRKGQYLRVTEVMSITPGARFTYHWEDKLDRASVTHKLFLEQAVRNWSNNDNPATEIIISVKANEKKVVTLEHTPETQLRTVERGGGDPVEHLLSKHGGKLVDTSDD